MKQFKKVIVVLMAAALLAGCSKSAPEQTSGTAQTAKQEASADTKTAESTQAPAKAAESTQAPAKAAETTPAPAKAAETTQAPAKAAETTPAPAKTAESTPAPAKAAETTPAPAKVAETTPAPAKTAETTPAPTKTADTADKAAEETKNTQTTAFAVKTDEAEDGSEYGVGAFLMQDGTTITVYGSELLRPEQDEDDILRFRLLDADGEDYGTDDDDFEILAGSYRDSGLAVTDEDHIGEAFDALLAFDTTGLTDEDDVVPFVCDERQGLYLVIRGLSGERSDVVILQDIDCDNFLLIRVREIPTAVKAEEVVSTVLLIL